MKIRLKFILILIFFIPFTSALASSCSYKKTIPCKKGYNPTTCLFNLIAERACLIKAVAAYKFVHGGSVYAPTQEMKILLDVGKQANRYQLNIYDLQTFTLVQMDISKLIEAYWMTHWKTHHIVPKAPKTLTQLRNKLVTIDGWLLSAIQQSLPQLHNPNNHKQLKKKIKNSLNVIGIPCSPNYSLMLLSTLIHIKKK